MGGRAGRGARDLECGPEADSRPFGAGTGGVAPAARPLADLSRRPEFEDELRAALVQPALQPDRVYVRVEQAADCRMQ